jgi:hypothetical protein
VEALDHINIIAANAFERARLVFLVVKFTLLVNSKLDSQGFRNPFAELAAGVETKDLHESR